MDNQAHRKAPESLDEHRAGVRHLRLTIGVFVVLCLTPYLHPDLQDFQVWSQADDPIPFSSLLDLDSESSSVASGGIAAPAVMHQSDEGSRTVVERQLGETIADNLGELAIGPSDGDEGEPVFPAERESTADSAGEEASPVPVVEPDPPELRIAAAEFEGVEEAIVLPEGPGISEFFESLGKTARGEAGAVTRVAHFGDSTIAADDITRTVRSNLQRRFGDAGHGFILAGKGHLPYRHKGIVWKPSGWKVSSLIHGRRDDGHYGFGGVVASSWGGGVTRIKTATRGEIGRHVGSFEIFHQTHPAGGTIRVQVDGGEWSEFSTKTEELGESSHVISLEDGPHELVYRAGGGGHVRLYGVALERPVPGVVWDSLGIVGARGSRLLNWDEAHLRTQFARRDPDLMILQFGGNEASDRMKMEWYRSKLTEVVRHMRSASPGVPCMVLAPLDQGENHRGRIRTMPNLPKMVAIQEEVALEEGCAFWNTWAAMGGEGAMRRWQKTGLGGSDFRHATPRGYEAIGNMFYKALLKAFDSHLGKQGGASASAMPVDTDVVDPEDAAGDSAGVEPFDAGSLDAGVADGDSDASEGDAFSTEGGDAGAPDTVELSSPGGGEAPRPEETP